MQKKTKGFVVCAEMNAETVHAGGLLTDHESQPSARAFQVNSHRPSYGLQMEDAVCVFPLGHST